MTKFVTTSLLLTAALYGVAAQTIHTISLGASYAKGEYYNLANDNKTALSHSDWDIAFSVYGTTDAAVFINEGSSFSGTAPTLYEIPNKTFSDNIQTSDLGGPLKNPETNWTTGAFNTPKIPGDWMDYGWGRYSMTNHQIQGTRLYAVQLGNGSYKKLTIDSLANGTYHFRYADFDGSNLQQHSIDKSTYTNQTLAYFSMATNTLRSAVEPAGGWDLLLTRYETRLYSTNPPTPYQVGGILLNQGVEAVVAKNINPATVDVDNYVLGADSLTLIGHDWKYYDFSAGWSVEPNRVYFVKTKSNELYQLEFIDFQGSSSGIATFQKTYLGVWTTVQKTPNSLVTQLGAFPNPAANYINVAFSLEQQLETVQLRLVSPLGQVVLEQTVETQVGLNGILLSVDDLPKGSYFLTLQVQKESITTTVVVD